MSAVMKLNVRSLDVWGHAPGGPNCDCDLDEHGEPTCRDMCGFEINDSFAAGSIEIPADATEEQVIETLIAEGYLSEQARGKVRIDDDGNGWQSRQVVESDDEGPLYFLDGEGDGT